MTKKADPIVTVLVRELNQGVNLLEEGLHPDRNREIVEHMCELSRDIRFRLGPLEFASTQQVEDLINSFEAAVVAISGINDPSLSAFGDNIARRARLMKSALRPLEPVPA